MTAETPVPVNHPLRKAWDAYKALDTYSNTRRWALHQDHVDGSMWAAFAEGWDAANRLASLTGEGEPIPMLLFCPACGTQHVDEPTEAWPNPPHRSHLCLSCGHIWRPADVPTQGVAVIQTRGSADSSPARPYLTGEGEPVGGGLNKNIAALVFGTEHTFGGGEGEPVAWRFLFGSSPDGCWSYDTTSPKPEWAEQCRQVRPLYTRPVACPDRDRIAVCISTHLSLGLGIDLPCVEVDKIADAILALSASGGGE